MGRRREGKAGFFFVFQKWLRAQRVGRVAPLGGGAKRRAAALGAAQRPKAPPQAAERRAAHEACFPALLYYCCLYILFELAVCAQFTQAARKRYKGRECNRAFPTIQPLVVTIGVISNKVFFVEE